MKRISCRIFVLLTVLVSASCYNSKVTESDQTNNTPMSDSSVTLEQADFYYQIKREYEDSYDDTIRIDTFFYDESQRYDVSLTYYCLSDTLIVPYKYNWSGDSVDWKTHNFESRLTMINNDDTLVNRVIRKEDFAGLLFDELRDFGVMMYPTFLNADTVKHVARWHYSISIPLTDVGKGVIVEVNTVGDLIFTE